VDLSVTGGGSYQLLVETDAAVSKILNEINGMETKTIKDNSQLNYRSYFPWFLAVAIILLIIELFYPERKPRFS
jgi:Ca-activated chloride channel family protein